MIAIAVDGPAGAGKSSVSKAVAKKLGIIYVDTGAMFRACALYTILKGIEITEENMKACIDDIEINIVYDDEGQRIILNGDDVSEKIREKSVSIKASDIAVIPTVRTKLLEIQRGLSQKQSVIMDGRDIGTVVLPNADVKIFLTASSLERAKRRCLEMEEKGMECDLKEVQKDIEYRDSQDAGRKTAPLKQADDAVLVDSSNLSFDEVVEKIIDIIKKSGAEV